MKRIKNRKFLSLVDKLNRNTNSKENMLSKFQQEKNYIIVFPVKSKYNKSLLNLFNSLKGIQRNYKEFKYTDRSYNTKLNDNIELNKQKDKISIKSKSNSLQAISNTAIQISYLKSLVNTLTNIDIICSLKKGDFYSDIYFKSIDPLYNTLDYYEKKKYIKDVKLKSIDIFNKQQFYKKYNYSTKDFKKSNLDHIFTGNLPITLGMLKVYSDILSINLIYKNITNSSQYMNGFNKNRVTIIIYEANDKIYTLRRKGTFLRGLELKNFLKFEHKPIKEILEKMKINEVQNTARMLNISTKKPGRVNKINKTKDEVIREILT